MVWKSTPIYFPVRWGQKKKIDFLFYKYPNCAAKTDRYRQTAQTDTYNGSTH